MEKRERKTYLDFAATSFPKPESVYRAVDKFSREIGIGNDRGNYEEGAVVASIMARARKGIAGLINAEPSAILFTSGTTESLNTFLLGYLRPGDHVITSPFEHNSVRRPLEFLRQTRDVKISMLPATLETGIDPSDVEKSITPRTRLVILNWASNVFGLVLPVAEIGKLLKDKEKVLFAIDGAQVLGSFPVDVEGAGIDFMAFPGHKALLGPTGTGGFFIREKIVEKVLPLKFGGTGLRSAEGAYLKDLPYKYEVGTQNSWGIAGLAAGVEFVRDRSVEAINEHIDGLTRKAMEGLKAIKGVTCYLPGNSLPHGIVSFNLDGLAARDTACLLDQVYGIKLRDGLHCSPDAHKLAGTAPGGTIRASFGILTTAEDIDYFLEAVKQTADSIPSKA